MNVRLLLIRGERANRGTALLIVVAAVTIASLVVGSYLFFVGDHRERSARNCDDAMTQIRLEQEILRARYEIHQVAKSEGKIDLSEINSNLATSRLDLAGPPESLKLTLNGHETGIESIESLAASSSSLIALQNQGDPFLWAKAIVLEVGIESSALTLGKTQSRLSSKAVLVNPHIDVRAIPVSQFTLCTMGSGLRLDQTMFAGPIGRIFALGDIQFFGNFSTIYPVVSGGNVDTVGSLTVSLDTNAPIQFSNDQVAYAQPSDSSQARWLAEARTTFNSAVINPGVLPVSLSLPPPANSVVSGSTQNINSGLDLATIRNRCNFPLLVRRDGRGGYQVATLRGDPAPSSGIFRVAVAKWLCTWIYWSGPRNIKATDGKATSVLSVVHLGTQWSASF